MASWTTFGLKPFKGVIWGQRPRRSYPIKTFFVKETLISRDCTVLDISLELNKREEKSEEREVEDSDAGLVWEEDWQSDHA